MFKHGRRQDNTRVYPSKRFNLKRLKWSMCGPTFDTQDTLGRHSNEPWNLPLVPTVTSRGATSLANRMLQGVAFVMDS